MDLTLTVFDSVSKFLGFYNYKLESSRIWLYIPSCKICAVSLNCSKYRRSKETKCIEKPLAYFFGEKVSVNNNDFGKSSLSGQPLWHVHCFETTSPKFTTNDATGQSQSFDQNSDFKNAQTDTFCFRSSWRYKGTLGSSL